jgi:hypothetical protein
MATIIAQPTPRVGHRMLVAGAVGVLLGGFAGGLVSRALQSRGDLTGTTRPVSESVFSPEAIRAYVGSPTTQVFSPEAIRAYVGSPATQVFSPEAIRAYVGSPATQVFSPEAIRAKNHVPQATKEALSPEALRMRTGSSHAEAFSPEAARLEN